jgi:hypothetical protein
MKKRQSAEKAGDHRTVVAVQLHDFEIPGSCQRVFVAENSFVVAVEGSMITHGV